MDQQEIEEVARRREMVAATCSTLTRAILERNADLAASVYADDAEIVIVNRNYPPSQPLLRRGRAAALELWRDICSKEMTHSIPCVVVGETGFAIREACSYINGGRVVGHVMAEVQDGAIVRYLSVDCWDE